MVLVLRVYVQSGAFIVESLIRKQYAHRLWKICVRYNFVCLFRLFVHSFVHRVGIVCTTIIYVFIVLLIKMKLFAFVRLVQNITFFWLGLHKIRNNSSEMFHFRKDSTIKKKERHADAILRQIYSEAFPILKSLLADANKTRRKREQQL